MLGGVRAALLSGSLGPSYGPELVTNGTFNTAATGWTPTNATLASVGGQLQITATAANAFATQNVSGLTIGATYRLQAQMTPQDGNNWADLNINGGFNHDYYYRVVGGTLDTTFILTSVSAVNIVCKLVDSINGFGGAGVTALFDNISLKKVN